MYKKIVYSKHLPTQRCGVAYFSSLLAKHLSAEQVNTFHGFSRCDELFINMDIYEFNESEVSSLLNFISSGCVKKTVLLMHDYRFTYLEDELVKKCNAVINLSGEPALRKVAGEKMLELFTPSSSELPILKFRKINRRPLSLSFGFFSPRKKSFKMYLSFYEYMLKKYPQWFHMVIVSTHVGDHNTDREFLGNYFNSDYILLSDFIPNQLLSELISASDLGVFFYPTGIMQNNAGPMAFFSQGKTVLTTYGKLTPSSYKRFTIDYRSLDKFDLSNLHKIKKLGSIAKSYYHHNLSWEVFMKEMYTFVKKF